ncbi:hypothetical protein M0R89_20735 (plasmid) [Halorussus limi]|uniref:Halobacterial output domain-containing protein n=1 Tax=Halorussus limi TaxID=2938695 RepID=A0A8U0I0J4_9EURY|nr:HalOD1 output domain-containing protein [Halorussus limi]UPV76895.1 hypothetical protein M0R89_20735 [Halorussus limi]
MSHERENRDICRYSIEGNEPLSLAVINCVSKMDDDKPEARPPLHEAIDPEALDNLFRNRRNGEVTFTYLDYEITVDGDAVTITRRLEERPVGAD